MMLNKRTVLSLAKINAIALSFLGLIHDIATFTPIIRGGLIKLTADVFNAIMYMSLMCGTSLILCGILLNILLSKYLENTFLKNSILLLGSYALMSGVLSAVFMPENPFAWIAFALGMCLFVLLILACAGKAQKE